MDLNPSLIPRFNIDYDILDLIGAIRNISKPADTSAISSIFPNNHIFYSNSGRTSLYIILKALDLKPNSKIGISLYTCPSDFDAILNAGHIPVFVDIDTNSFNMDISDLVKKIDMLDAIVVVHLFGRPARMDEVIQIAGSRPVIEDCAHSLLSKYRNKLTGTIGTAGFFSFRSGKYISAGEGGMIVCRDDKLSNKIKMEIEKLKYPSRLEELKHAVISYLRAEMYHKPWFGLLSLPLGSRIENKVDLMNKYSFNTSHIRNSNLYVINKKIKDFGTLVNKNRRNSESLIEYLKNSNIILPIEPQDTYWNYFLFPILFNDRTKRDVVSDCLRKNGIDSAKMFSKTPSIAKENYGYPSDCQNAEYVGERILVIPHYYTLSSKDLIKICEVLKSCLL